MAFFEKLFGKKETPQERTKKDQKMLEKTHSDAHEIINILQSIDFYSADNKLAPEIIKEEAYAGICKQAVKWLTSTEEITRDISGLDAVFVYAANALQEAIRDGHPTKAHWAAIALYKGLKELRTEIRGTVADHEEQVYEKRLAYANNLKIIIQQGEQLDIAQTSLNDQTTRYESLQQEITKLQTWFDQYVETPEGSAAYANMNRFASTPEIMSENAKNMQDQMQEIKAQKEVAGATYKQIMTLRQQIRTAKTQISIARNQLSMGINIVKPEQLAEIQMMLDNSIKNMKTTLDEIKKTNDITKKYFHEMELLGEHPVFLDDAADAVRIANDLKNQKNLDLNRRAQVLEQMRRDQMNEKIAQEILEAAQKRYEQLDDVNPVYVENPVVNIEQNQERIFAQ